MFQGGKHVKKKIFLAVITLGIICFIVYANIASRVIYNDADAIGSTAGNLLNGGLFCEYDNKIYFANSNDSDKLYSMDSNCTNFKRLTNCAVKQINAAGKYAYYSIVDSKKSASKKDNGSSMIGIAKKGLYRINKNGSDAVTLYSNFSGDLALSGNTVYYQHYDEEEGISLYGVKIDGKTGSCVLRSSISPASVKNNVLYYAEIDGNHNIYSYNLKTKEKDLIAEGNFGCVMLSGNFLYYLDLDKDYNVGRMNLDGSGQKILVNEHVSTFNVSNDQKYLYYQIDNAKDNGLYQMTLKNKKTQSILKGNFNSIHVTSNYVFFKEFDTELNYIFPVEKNPEASLFNPPKK